MLESVRGEAAQLDVARATAEADLAHLAAACVETRAGDARRGRRRSRAARARRAAGQPHARWTMRRRRRSSKARVEPAGRAEVEEAARAESAPTLTADEMVLDLRVQDRADGRRQHDGDRSVRRPRGPPLFLTTQRKDLIDSIAATSEAIKKIDKTTRERFTRSVHRHQPELRADVHDAVRRRPRRPGAARRERLSSRAASTSSRSRRASGCRASSCCRAARRRSPRWR